MHYLIKQRSYLNISPINRQKHLLVDTRLIEWIVFHAEVVIENRDASRAFAIR